MIAIGLRHDRIGSDQRIVWWRGRKTANDSILPVWLLKVLVAAIPLGYIANGMRLGGSRSGRQPWAVYGLLRTEHAASNLPATAVSNQPGDVRGYLYFIVRVIFAVARRIIMNGRT